MAYTNPLPLINLEAVDIRDTIGIGSDNNLSHYIVKAKSGGLAHTSNSDLNLAFNTLETGTGTSDDGTLISGAHPYFNIWSASSPGEWTYTAINGLHFRLKRNSYGDINVNGETFDQYSYCYDLGAFRGYNHTSIAPYIYTGTATVDEETISSQNLGVTVHLGQIDWIYAIASNQSSIDRSNYYIELTLSSTGSNVTSGKKALYNDYYSTNETSINTTISSLPIAASYTCSCMLYEQVTDTTNYNARGYLPLTSSGATFTSFSNSVSISPFTIIYVPRLTIAVSNNSGTYIISTTVSSAKMTLSGTAYKYSATGISYQYNSASQGNVLSGSVVSVSATNTSGTVTCSALITPATYNSSSGSGTFDIDVTFSTNLTKNNPMPVVTLTIK